MKRAKRRLTGLVGVGEGNSKLLNLGDQQLLWVEFLVDLTTRGRICIFDNALIILAPVKHLVPPGSSPLDRSSLSDAHRLDRGIEGCQ